MEYKELFDKIYNLSKKKKSFSEICELLELKDYEVLGLISLMKESGYVIDYVNGNIININNDLTNKKGFFIPKDKSHIRFMALSDTHLGSKWDNVDLLKYAYGLAEDKECDFVTHSGDILEGDFHSKRPDHVYQVRAHGLEQVDYAIDKYPQSSLKTYFCIGNHDLTFVKTCGADIGKMIAKERPELIYLGQDLADLEFEKIKIRLRHGAGSASYSKSYKLQKYCETLPVSDMPNIILQGHFHFSGYFKNRGIYCFNVPSLQGYTPFAKAMGMESEMGFWIIDLYTDKDGNINRITPELYNFDGKEKTLRKKK
jgi:predicted phosphodiesterase